MRRMRKMVMMKRYQVWECGEPLLQSNWEAAKAKCVRETTIPDPSLSSSTLTTISSSSSSSTSSWIMYMRQHYLLHHYKSWNHIHQESRKFEESDFQRLENVYKICLFLATSTLLSAFGIDLKAVSWGWLIFKKLVCRKPIWKNCEMSVFPKWHFLIGTGQCNTRRHCQWNACIQIDFMKEKLTTVSCRCLICIVMVVPFKTKNKYVKWFKYQKYLKPRMNMLNQIQIKKTWQQFCVEALPFPGLCWGKSLSTFLKFCSGLTDQEHRVAVEKIIFFFFWV